MSKTPILVFIFFSAYSSGVCQLKKIKSLKISSEATYAAIDRPGDLYVISGTGTIQKIDGQGKIQYTVAHPAPPTVFDPRDGARIFAYYQDTRQYVFLNPALTTNAPPNKLDEAFAIHPFLVSSFGDQHILILDSADWTLKKVHTKTSVVAWEANVKSSFEASNRKDLSSLREYQNFIFVLDPKEGILVFNAIGKLLKIIEAKGISYFNFLGEELYFLQHGRLKFFNLFTAERREMNLPSLCDFALITDERLFLIRKNEVDIFKLEP